MCAAVTVAVIPLGFELLFLLTFAIPYAIIVLFEYVLLVSVFPGMCRHA